MADWNWLIRCAGSGAAGGTCADFHRSGVDDMLFDILTGGEKVTFEVELSPKAPRAN